ncbi:pyrroloquinoline quinone biosynthesis protein PqqB [Streptomyces spectabilis]|uniref:Coenzyme PQQ synthesis protein B n=1 Tax=Streptomyces spectabilis TaxID=68270 RepID=A0A5P2XI52_STRST|nr:MBL fold metallo-hydrolase [Streptomyces spectabilis]MBB5107064.1 pyrroloquinoline quinone biosynthesis protein B [Streptomyces spectabilis]MCI3906113.1 MBL fold metallo-hydrolase [Streptomyces spectabilis]QEV62999.1 pyrroloquinoline quinone biosynthesis protein PqqB [Streptomyces spectabilis]GGV04789.1 coenzyme PQQ synthesis protein B [Streptomyces spectabilis]
MLLQVLGTAAGGGLPQWNCACPGCAGARAHPGRRRRHASLAVRAGPGRWYLVNATPDIGEQIEECPGLLPGPGADVRRSPLAGVLLTDAELDHTLGIARLREARDGVDVCATAPVLRAVRERLGLGAVLGPYTTVRWRELTGARTPLGEGAEVTVDAVPVSAKRPRYAADATGPAAEGDAWSVALRLRDTGTGATALYAPALAAWTDAFEDAAREADVVIVDGTFWDDEEPLRSGFSRTTATGMGHLPITGPGGTAHRLARLPGRCLYTHLNNTNPLGDPGAEQHKHLADQGLDVAAERMVIEL